VRYKSVLRIHSELIQRLQYSSLRGDEMRLAPVQSSRILACGRNAVFFFVFSLILGCTALSQQRLCQRDGVIMVSDMLYFGTERPTGSVTPAEWQHFLEAIVTPRFPLGFTSWETTGQWQEPDGRIVRERSYVLQILHPDDQRQDREVEGIVLKYKDMYQQKSVLHVRSRSCASFHDQPAK